MRRKLKRLVNNPYRVFYRFNYLKISHLLSDETLLRLIFRARLGYKLDLNNPKTFNEKIQWLKLYDRRSEYTTYVDKAAVKEFVSERIGKEYIIPQLGVWNSFDEIDFDSLPNQFVLKSTHDSGSTVICKDKRTFDIKRARKKLNYSMRSNFYYRAREWAYKNVVPRIVAEEYIFSNKSSDLPDYKFFCFGGSPEYIMLCQNRFSSEELTFDFYDKHWQHMDFLRPPFHPNSKVLADKPENFEEMISLAKNLSMGIPFVRVDFYSVNNRVYFGEMTFYPGDGFEPFEPEIWDKKLGDKLILPIKREFGC